MFFSLLEVLYSRLGQCCVTTSFCAFIFLIGFSCFFGYLARTCKAFLMLFHIVEKKKRCVFKNKTKLCEFCGRLTEKNKPQTKKLCDNMKKIDPSQWIILSNERRKENSDYIRVKKKKKKRRKINIWELSIWRVSRFD